METKRRTTQIEVKLTGNVERFVLVARIGLKMLIELWR